MTNGRLTKIVDSVLNLLIAVTFSVLIVACVLQVFTRFVLNTSLSWTEELARYAFIWSNMLGAAFCTKRASRTAVTVIVDTVPKAVQKVLKVMVYIYWLLRFHWFYSVMALKLLMMFGVSLVRRYVLACPLFIVRCLLALYSLAIMQSGILFFTMFLMIFISVPVAFSIFGSGMIYLLVTGLKPLSLVCQRAVTGLDSFPLLAVPLFVFVGDLMDRVNL